MNRILLDWVGEAADEHNVLIARNPYKDYAQEQFFGQSIVLREWGKHRWYFSVPDGVIVQPIDKWQSDSNGQVVSGQDGVKSEMLYPWFWNLDGYDVVCQIAPPNSVSSFNSHRKTVEFFAPVQNDGSTFLRIGDELNLLETEVRVECNAWHQIVRRGGGYSVQLLKMMGPVRFPRRDDHHYG